MRKFLLFICWVALDMTAFSADHYLVGYAPDFVGKEVKLYTYQEYITMKKIEIGEGMVAESDSIFRIPLDIKTTVKGIIEIDGTEAFIYLAPKSNYDVYFHRVEGPVSFSNKVSEVTFFGLDSTDINYRILQYHQWFDTFVAYYEKPMSSGGFLAYLDTFKRYAAEAYQKVDDVYFLTYVRYDIAEMEQTYGGNAEADKRLETFLNYIQPFPVYFENDKYMNFVKRFYHQDFDDYDPDTEKEIFKAIDAASPTLLMKALKRDLFLVNPELREMFMLDKLGKQFYVNNYDKPLILHMLDSVSHHARYQISANIASNIRDYLTTLESGFPAPYLELQLTADSTLYWKNYQGKFVYLTFFESWDEKARAEMKVMVNLKKKYQEDIAFLSLCTDKNKASFDKFMNDNPDFDWDIIYIGPEHPLLHAYKVETVPAYFLINQDAYIFAAPALSPSPSGAEYFSIDKTFFDIQSAMHPVKGVRPGEK